MLNILARSTRRSTTRACAEALHTFSSFDDCAPLLIREHAVQALIVLSQTQDIRTRQACAATFCNFLSAEGNHAAVMDQVGGWVGVFMLCALCVRLCACGWVGVSGASVGGHGCCV
jgi:hypothetical protein